MKILIAVMTCHKYANRAQVQRNTWVRWAAAHGIDVRFFVGECLLGEYDHPADTVHLMDVPDDYIAFPRKVRAMFQWAYNEGYDAVLKTDDDTLVLPQNFKLLLTNPPGDYYGRLRGPSGTYIDPDPKGITRGLPTGFQLYGPMEQSFCSGLGYVLSRRAMKVIAEAAQPIDWAEDRWVGQQLYSKGIKPTDCNRFMLYGPWARCAAHTTWDGVNDRTCRACMLRRQTAIVVCPFDKPELVETMFKDYQQEVLC